MFKSSELVCGLALIIGARLVFMEIVDFEKFWVCGRWLHRRGWLWISGLVMKIFKSSEFAGVGSTVEVGFDYRGLARSNRDFLKFWICGCWLYRRGCLCSSGIGSYQRRFQKVLNLRVLALPWKLALTIGAWLVLIEMLKSSEILGGLALIIGAWFVFMEMWEF